MIMMKRLAKTVDESKMLSMVQASLNYLSHSTEEIFIFGYWVGNKKEPSTLRCDDIE